MGKSGHLGQLPLRGPHLARAGASSAYKEHGCCSVWKSFICDIAAYSLSTYCEWNHGMHWRDSSELNIQTPLLSQLGFRHALEGFGEGERSEGEI